MRLKFPSDIPLGRLDTRFPGEPWKPAALAFGEVDAPDGAEHRLRLSRAALVRKERLHALPAEIQALDASGIPLMPWDFEALRQFGHLRSLDFSRTMMDDFSLRCISQMESLKHLDISWNSISGEGLAALAEGQAKLESLAIDGLNILDEDFLCLGKLKTLKSLRSRNMIGNHGFVKSGLLSQLVSFAPGGQALWETYHALQAAPLRSLDTPRWVLPLECYEEIGKYKHLDTLSLSDTATDQEVRLLGGLQNLRILFCNVSLEAGCHLLKLFPNLELLSFNNDGFWPEDIEGLSSHQKLRCLLIQRADLEYEALKNLKSLSQLTRLSFRSSTLNDEKVGLLEPLGFLEKLSIQSSQLTSLGLYALKEMLPNTQISHAPIRIHPPISDANYWAVGAIPPTQNQLFFREPAESRWTWAPCLVGPGLIPPTYELSFRVFGSTPSDLLGYRRIRRLIKEIRLDHADLKAEACRMMGRLPFLNGLIAESTEILPEFLEMLSQLERLQFLTLNDCDVETDDLKTIIPKLSRLKVLSLRDTLVDDKIITPITKVRELEEVNLIRSHVTGKGIERLRKKRPALKILYHQ